MQKMIKTLAIISIASLAVIGCKKNDIQPIQDAISQETLTKIYNLGFSTSNVQKIDEGYLVEGDIILTNASLNQRPGSPNLRIAEVEQYRTFNLVSQPRYINVSVSGSVSTAFSDAVNGAIARYNAQGLALIFQRVTSGGDINVKIVNTGQYIASSGFPTSSGGAPYNQISYAKKYTAYSADFMTTVIAHEMGHCIGFRHTDYMNRSYSCGIGGNEGQETTGVGAVGIPGTPTGPDAASWMLACLSSTTDRPFNTNDVKALDYLYK
jgi:Dual-action HEIGH metallo-peptidase